MVLHCSQWQSSRLWEASVCQNKVLHHWWNKLKRRISTDNNAARQAVLCKSKVRKVIAYRLMSMTFFKKNNEKKCLASRVNAHGARGIFALGCALRVASIPSHVSLLQRRGLRPPKQHCGGLEGLSPEWETCPPTLACEEVVSLFIETRCEDAACYPVPSQSITNSYQ